MAVGGLVRPPSHQPGERGGGEEARFGKGCEFDPLEGEFVFEAGDRIRPGALGVFHMKQNGELVLGLASLQKNGLAGEQEEADLDREAGFFEELTGEGLGGCLPGLDMAAGEVAVAVLPVSADQQPGAVCGKASGDELDTLRGVLQHTRKLSSGIGGQRWGGGGITPYPIREQRKEAKAMATQKQRRLGRGLSSLIGTQEPIQVAAPPQESQNTPQNPPHIGDKAGVSSGTNSLQNQREDGVGGAEPVGEGMVRLVAVGEIEPNRFQPRRHFDEESLTQLAASIERSGLMQPIIVRPVGNGGSGGGGGSGGYELVAGERRWRAARLAGLTEVPAVVRSLADGEAAEWALVENIQREDLNPIERAHGLRRLAEQFGLSHADLGERVGLDRSTVANLIRLTELEEPIQVLVSEGRLAMGHARAIVAMPTGAARLDLAKRAAEAGWSVRQVEQAVRHWTQTQLESLPKETSNKTPTQREAVIADIERRLSDHLGTKTKITLRASGNRGRVQVEFFSLEQFEGLMERMGLRDEDG